MDKKQDGPTVFDINKPNTFGVAAGSRPVITGHQPTMLDPMVNPAESQSASSKITVKVDNDKSDSVDADKLANSLFTETQDKNRHSESSLTNRPPAIMEGEPLQSPPFKPDSKGETSAQRAPYMAVSDLTGINPAAIPKPAGEISDSQITTEPKPAVFGSESNLPEKEPKKKDKKSGSKVWLWLLLLLVILAGLYVAVDKGLIFKDVNLPFHIFKQEEAVTDTQAPAISSTTSTNPTGITTTKLVEAGLTFAYPTSWGAPTATADQGFSKRAPNAKPDVNYAFLVSFPGNKDVQMAITSGKFLPPTRAALYYDFLGWCVGTADGKYYAGVLRFTTDADKNDIPSTVTCDQGPLNNVTKLDADTIVQTNIKNTDGTLLGDIYTKNTTSNPSYVVVRAMDATMKNGDQIKKLLDTVKPL